MFGKNNALPMRAAAAKDLLVSRNDSRAAVRKALKLYVGPRRRFSVKELSNNTGVPDRMIESAMAEYGTDENRPLNLECLLSIAKFLGDGFVTEWLGLAGLGAYTLPDEALPHPTELVRDLASDTAEVAEMAADGQHFDHEDHATLRELGHDFVERGMVLVASVMPKRRAA